MGNPNLKQRWPAPAKLNLALRIVGRRADGYHRLQTIFQFLDICDYLSFEPRSDGQICRSQDLREIPREADLSLRAAQLLQARHGPTPGVTIHLHKQLPIGGGLGGGSSDAATTLVALNHYWNLGLDVQSLAALGRELGADVPVFVCGHTAWGEERGDVLTPLLLPERWFVVLIPTICVSTREVFQDQYLTRDALPVKIRCLFSESYSNAFESVVFRRFPEVADAAHWLTRHATAHLTGTGSCVFAAFERYRDALSVAKQAPYKVLLARGCDFSHLQQRLQQEKMQSTTGP